MKNVVLRAPLLSKSGYGVHSRQVFKYLLTKPHLNVRTQIVPWGITPWGVADDSFESLAPEILSRTDDGSSNTKYDISLQVQLPHEWDASIANFNIGVTAGVETDKCSPVWTSVHCSKMDLVIVPSAHTKKTLENSGVTTTPIVVVPESYFAQLTQKPEPLDLELKTNFNFLAVGVLTGMTPATDRKNMFYLIKWFIEEFRNDRDVGLILKTNRGRETSIDKSLTEGIIRKVLHELQHEGTPRVYLMHGDMSRKEMNSLYRHPKIKALVSPTRGEGFGLPLLEAAVAELPVIATGWSAHTEFLNKGKWLSVDFSLEDVHPTRIDNTIFVPGSKWAEVSELSFKKTLRKFRKSSSVPKKWATNLSKILSEEYSEKSVFKKYEEVLGEILN